MYITRHIEKVVERISKRKGALIVTGSRQVGKSTMLKKQFKTHKYITLDKPIIAQQAQENLSLFLEINQGKIIIDEIQKAPSLFEYIKADIDEHKEYGKFILTGSQSFRLMKHVTESLAGRAGIIQMCGLSKRELNNVSFSKAFKPTKEQLLQKQQQAAHVLYNYKKIVSIIHKGSFPELYERESTLEDWSDFYNSYVKTYIEKDVREIINIQNESAFIKFLKAIAARTGQQLNFSSLAEICGKDINTMKSWLSVLETSGLVYLLQPYYNNFNKRLIKTPKIYFVDTGLVCFLCGWNTPDQLANGAMWGHIFETYVIGEVLKSYYNDGITDPPIYYYRDKEKNEIDLIIEEGGNLYPVEIKTTGDPSRSMIFAFEVLKKIQDKNVGEGAIVCLAKEVLPLANDAWIIPVDMI